MSAIKEADLRRDLFVLGSDEMRGREAGTVDELRASGWLVEAMRKAGLEPAGLDGTWYQWWPMRRIQQAATSTFSIPGHALTLWRDVIVRSPVEGRFDLPLTDADKLAADARLDGQAAVATLVPVNANRWGSLQAYRDGSAGAARLTQALIARGAAAVVLVADASTDSAFAFFASAASRGTLRPRHGNVARPRGAAGAARAPVARRCPARARHRSRSTCTWTATRTRRSTSSARVRGTDPKLRDEYVLYSSHQDHDGVRYPVDGDSIWNGADDNALDERRPARHRPCVREAAGEALGAVRLARRRGARTARARASTPRIRWCRSRDRRRAQRRHDRPQPSRHRLAARLAAAAPQLDASWSQMALDGQHAARAVRASTRTWDRPTHPEGWYFRSDHLPYARAGVPAHLLHDRPAPRLPHAARRALAHRLRQAHAAWRSGCTSPAGSPRTPPTGRYWMQERTGTLTFAMLPMQAIRHRHPPSGAPMPVHLADPDHNPSFTKAIFFGDIREDLVFPFPEPSADEKESRAAILDSFRAWAKDTVDAAKHDHDGKFTDETRAGDGRARADGAQHPRGVRRLRRERDGVQPHLRRGRRHRPCPRRLLRRAPVHRLQGHHALRHRGRRSGSTFPSAPAARSIAAFCLTEPGSGSDAQAMRTTAVPSADGSHYVLNGTEDLDLQRRLRRAVHRLRQGAGGDGRQDEAARDGVHRRRARARASRSASSSRRWGSRRPTRARSTFENVKVPTEDRLGDVGSGFKIALEILNSGRLGLAAALVARHAHHHATSRSTYAKQREQFGRPIGSFEMIQRKFAAAAVDCYASDAAWMLTASMVDRGGVDFSLETACCKIFASELACRTAQRRAADRRRHRLLQGVPVRAVGARLAHQPDLRGHQRDPARAHRALGAAAARRAAQGDRQGVQESAAVHRRHRLVHRRPRQAAAREAGVHQGAPALKDEAEHGGRRSSTISRSRWKAC